MIRPPLRRRVAVLLLAPTVVGLAACGADSPTTPAPPSVPAAASAAGANAADTAFIRHMLPHHERALQVGALMAAQGADPRVRAFGRQILAEQTPERDRLTSWVATLGLTPTAADSAMATGLIDDPAFTRLRGKSGTAFDRDALLSSATSETGAADMSATELAGGTYGPARTLAQGISTAPTGEIPALRGLAAQL